MPRLPLTVATAVVIVAIAAGCATSGSSPSAGGSAPPSGVASSSAPPSVAASATATASGSASGAPGTTTIDWGVIWDALPPTFPMYPGSHATVTGGGPASAVLDLPADAPTASTWFQAALKTAGFAIVGANGPREDGSYDIVASRGSADCQAEISLAPLGTITTATIYLAAACPFG